jgi:glycosyltransferase involved in cell wall biosynthesis/SAM-dependent methyltransferase
MEPDLSLVIPTYNEATRLPRTLEHLQAFAESAALNLEVVVSDDGSTDGTADLVRKWTVRPEFVVRLVEVAHRGKGAAVREGMNHVTGRIVGCFDADLSPGTDAVAQLLAEMQSGADMVIASRGLPESVIEVHPAWYREVAGHVFNFLLRKLSGIPFRDTQCGLKLFRADVAKEIFRYQRVDGFAFDAELVVLASRLGYTVKEIPVTWAHSEGSRVSLVRDAFRMSRDIFRVVRRLGKGDIHAPGIPSMRAMEVMSTSEDRHWWYVAKRQVVLTALEAAGKGRCLDLGCGGGAMLAAAAGASVPAFGVDLSTQALDHASGRGLNGLVRAEAGALPFPEGSFNSALLLDVLEHHARPEGLLKEVRRVLAPDGVLIVTVPAFQWMWSYADHVLGHYRRYTRHQLDAELRSCGFEVKRLTYFHSWLLPVAWLFRKLRTLMRSTNSADDFEVPPLLNKILLQVTRLEMKIMKRFDLPFGLSVLAVAGRTQDAQAVPAPEVLELAP